MYEHIVAVLLLNETKPLAVVEPLDYAVSHYRSSCPNPLQEIGPYLCPQIRAFLHRSHLQCQVDFHYGARTA
jgi:hypothetical protein